MVEKFSSGDVVWMDFDPSLGHEQRGRRPAIVLSSSHYNSQSGLMLVIPVTTKVKGYPFEVVITTKELSGVALVDQIKCIDWTVRNVQKITSIAKSPEFAEIVELVTGLVSGE